MKIVNVIGGLGNQMFQYAFAFVQKQLNPKEDYFIDVGHFKSGFFHDFKGMNLHYGFEVDKVFPNASIQIANKQQLRKVTRYVPNYLLSRLMRKFLPKRRTEYIEKDPYLFESNALTVPGNWYFEGYWQSAQYFAGFEDKIKKEFAFAPLDSKNSILAEEMKQSNSVTVHVRRGDYVSNPGFGGICEIPYYERAIARAIKKLDNPVFYIFSNDIDWCRKELAKSLDGCSCLYVDHNIGSDSYKDMVLMTYAKCNIIANSSFSWWAAFLNKSENPVIFAPAKWNNHYDKIDIYPGNWIII